MKLFQTYLSPFPTRVRLMLYAKGLNFDVVTPTGFHGDGLEKGEYLAVNPIGRVPTLVLDDGHALPESEVICEYLEDVYPEPSLRPEDPWERAQMRLLSRISDIYVVMAMLPLFNMGHWHRNTGTRNESNSNCRKLPALLTIWKNISGSMDTLLAMHCPKPMELWRQFYCWWQNGCRSFGGRICWRVDSSCAGTGLTYRPTGIAPGSSKKHARH